VVLGRLSPHPSLSTLKRWEGARNVTEETRKQYERGEGKNSKRKRRTEQGRMGQRNKEMKIIKFEFNTATTETGII
jgi:hypothetical protein